MSINKNDIDKCRLCLSEHDKSDLTPIFTETESIGMSLASRIMICLSLPIQAKDSLPECVCKICENQIMRFYAFRENCLSAYYSMPDRTTLYNGEERYCEADDNFEDNADTRLNKVENKGSNLNSEQNTPESYVVCIDNRSAKNYIQKTFIPDTNSESNFERISPHSRPLKDDTISVIPETNVYSENFPCGSYDRTSKDNSRDEKLSGKVDTVNEPGLIVKYKCLRCDNLFVDLDTASIHCSQCSRAENCEFPEKTADDTTTEYLDENIDEEWESCENIEEIARISAKKSTTSTRDENSRAKIRNEGGASKTSANLRNFKVSGEKSSLIVEKKKARTIKYSHPCPNCKTVFSNASLLRRHSFIHTGKRPLECPICKKRFSQIGPLNFHKKTHANPRHRCEFCKKPFFRRSDMAKHMRVHTGEKPYDCKICSKSFARLTSLTLHKRIHTGEKPYVCKICQKGFSQRCNRDKHVKIHKDGAKPHTCKICGRSFSDVSEMRLHRAGHDGGKPRQCSYCDKSFRMSSELSMHTRLNHTFEKPYKCAFCQKAYYSKYSLKQHVVVHMGHKPYKCTLCDVRFTQKGNLTKHYKRKHAEYKSNEDKYVVVDENFDEIKEAEILMLANVLLNDTNDSLIVETLEENIEKL